MNDEDLSLYQEEQRQLLIDMNKGILKLSQKLDAFVKKYEPPVKDVKVTGEVSVNTEKSVSVNNLEDVNFEKEAEKIIEAIKAQPTEVTVKNIKEAKPSEIEVSNQKDYTKNLEKIVDAVIASKAEVNVEKTEVVFPTNPKKPVAVRLSDGKSFYNALTAVASAFQQFPLVTSTETGELAIAVANADGTPISGGTVVADDDNLLLENGDALLLENGDELLLESA